MADSQLCVTLLGTGTSTGIPVIGCTCRVCCSTDSRDSRLRCSCFVQSAGVNILIDAGPDFRTQALRTPVKGIDAVLITHHHFDHVVGLDDLRPYFFGNRATMPCYSSEATAKILRRTHAYIFVEKEYPGVANLEMIPIRAPFDVADRGGGKKSVRVTPIPVMHGDLEIFGYRIGDFAYLTDTSLIPESSLRLLRDLDVLVLDGLRYESHSKHLTIPDAIELARIIGAGQTYFIHMAHSILHAKEDALLPDSMNLGYDGLRFSARL